MRLLIWVALRHLSARKRQSLVSLLGIILGVAFFLAISSLMRGSEADFIRRLVDNSPHITISDEFRQARLQPAEQLYPKGAVEIRRVRPASETRGIRSYEEILAFLRTFQGLRASPMFDTQALINFAGRDFGITLSGVIPEELLGISTIEKYMIEGSVNDLSADPDGIIIGAELARRLSLSRGDTVGLTAPTSERRNFKIIGLFRTGRSSFDERQAFVVLPRVQALMNRPNRANRVLVQLDQPQLAQEIASRVENSFAYKSVSWQEASEDLMSTLVVRNTIMYTVVSAVLIVAAFGIYNVISTVVTEKHRDIAILKSMGFQAREVQRIFVIQGVVLGLVGCAIGLPLGSILMAAMMSIKLKPPGVTEHIPMPIDWGWQQFAVAAAFAMSASILAALLPARKGAAVQPVQILRGGA